MTENPKIEDGYIVVEPVKLDPPEIRGIKCGKCGMTFDYGTPYGYCCPASDCPIQLKPYC